MNRILLGAATLVVAFGCMGGPALETETFQLQYTDGHRAAEVIQPYVYTDRQKAPGSVSYSGNVLTVRETRDNLGKIARVLSDIDQPRPTVRLHFQLIRATDDGAERFDPAIGEVVEELRTLFRYKGYALLHEAVVGGTEGSHIEQVVGMKENSAEGYVLIASIGSVWGSADSGTVSLEVGVRSPMRGALMTTVNARAGQTLVVVNAELVSGGGTLILTVRPEFLQ